MSLTLLILGFLANSEDRAEMPHKAAFDQGLHYLLNKIEDQRMKNLVFVTDFYVQWAISNVFIKPKGKFISAQRDKDKQSAFSCCLGFSSH